MKDGRLNVFISWSGDQSLHVAQALYDWLPEVLQVVKPYLSVEDTAKGTYWLTEVQQQLYASDFGIICLTPSNTTAPWINFEAGALSNTVERGKVTPFLYGLKQTDVTTPLSLFQATESDNPADVLRLIRDLDAICSDDRALGEKRMEGSFKKWWPDLRERLSAISAPQAIHQRPVEDMVRELLDGQRALERFISDSAGRLLMEALAQQAVNGPAPELLAALEDLLKDLTDALNACAGSGDPAIEQVAALVTEVRMVHEKMTGSARTRWRPLRGRVNPDQRGLPPGGA
jgi:hypothetical protein